MITTINEFRKMNESTNNDLERIVDYCEEFSNDNIALFMKQVVDDVKKNVILIVYNIGLKLLPESNEYKVKVNTLTSILNNPSFFNMTSANIQKQAGDFSLWQKYDKTELLNIIEPGTEVILVNHNGNVNTTAII